MSVVFDRKITGAYGRPQQQGSFILPHMCDSGWCTHLVPKRCMVPRINVMKRHTHNTHTHDGGAVF